MSEPTFSIPLGDSLLSSEPATLVAAGDQTGVGAKGTLFLTDHHLAFHSHTRAFTWPLTALRPPSLHRPRRFWVLPGAPVLRLEIPGPFGPVDLAVDNPTASADKIRTLQDSAPQRPAARERLRTALLDGVTERARYAETLVDLAFPGGFWHPDDADSLLSELLADAERLDLPLDASTLHHIARGVRQDSSPDDDEDALRAEQLCQLAAAIRAALPADCERSLHRYQPDLEGWEVEDPLFLWLDHDEHRQLCALGVVTPWSDGGQ